MFTITLLPAGHGDCLWIEYGDASNPRRILIDCGPTKGYESLKRHVATLPADRRRLELFVITHIDADHIEGAVKLLDTNDPKLEYADLWFNGWKQLASADLLGVEQADEVAKKIQERRLPHNLAFGGQVAVIPDEGPLPSFTLAGGLKLTLLGPTLAGLRELKEAWMKDPKFSAERAAQIAEAGAPAPADLLGAGELNVEQLAAWKTVEDDSPTNGSSIAFIAEYEHKRVLFAADAHPSVLETSLRRYLSQEEMESLTVDAYKVGHHCSRKSNTSLLFSLVQTSRYLISTNGSHFKHPDQEAVAKAIKAKRSPATFFFNYRTKFNEMWDNADLQRRYSYATKYPTASDTHGVTVTL
jgi:beta-lactamase superfamily II metal-dependent hydrolase